MGAQTGYVLRYEFFSYEDTGTAAFIGWIIDCLDGDVVVWSR